MKVVQIGYGYWGANIAKKLLQSKKFELVAVCEPIEQRRMIAKESVGDSVSVNKDYKEYLEKEQIQAVIIATQTEASYEIAVQAIRAGKHIFIEKPIATTFKKAEHLRQLAYEKKVILHCDHLLIYHPCIRYVKNMIEQGELGDLIYYDVDKINLGPIRKDVNAMMDLAVHDIAVLDYLLGGVKPVHLCCLGETAYGKQETLTYLLLKYPKFIAHIKSSWISPIKMRQTIIAGTKKMVVFDDMSVTEKLKIYNSGIDVIQGDEYGQYEFQNRVGDIFIPYIPAEDSLQNSLEFFASCVEEKRQSISGPEQCLRVMEILEWAQKSLAETE